MHVTVKWLISPRQRHGIPRAPGTFSELDAKVAKKILEISPGIFEYVENPVKEKPIRVKDTMQKRTRTRPVEK